METTVLTLEIKQANNPGFTDFGSGSIIALTSQCLRCTKKSNDCTICSDFCPASAIETTLEGRPRIKTGDCIKCAACVGACPTNALGCSSGNIQQFKRSALEATMLVDHLVVCCERTPALLRLQSRTDAPEEALESLRHIEEAQATDHLRKVACLAMVPKEIWFSILNEIGTLKFRELSVFLPLGQCAECPVNAKDNIEDQFGEAIVEAEKWTGRSIGIITEAKDLPKTRKANVRAYLASGNEMDRRGIFTGFIDELRLSWEDNMEVGNKATNKLRVQKEHKDSFARTLLSVELKKPKLAAQNPIAVASRYALIESLGYNDEHAENVKLLVSATHKKRCNRCGTCIEVCPLKARTFVEVVPKQQKDGDKTSSDSTNTASGNIQIVKVREMYCVACSACIQACPNRACYYKEITGQNFLVKESKVKPEDKLKAKPGEKPESKTTAKPGAKLKGQA